MYVDDLGRMLGWEFSLMVATVRLINSGLFDELPTLKIQMSHFVAALAAISRAYAVSRTARKMAPPRYRAMGVSRDRHLIGISNIACSMTVADGRASMMLPRQGAEWVRTGLTELPTSQVVFATDYPQGVQDDDQVAAYVNSVRALGPEARAVLNGANAEKLGSRLKVSMPAIAR